MFISWKTVKTYRCRSLHVNVHGGGVADRQPKILGFIQEVLSKAIILCVGAGGLISHIGEALVRKGVGHLILCDDDTVAPSNLNRQKFYKADLYKNKGLCLARNLSKEGFLGTKVTGISLSFQDAVRLGLIGKVDGVICGVDDDLVRELVSEWARDNEADLVSTAVSSDGDAGYVHIQKPGESCWGCAFPREKRIQDDLGNYRRPCPGTPAIKDILMVVSGLAVYALDTLLMDRPINWNYREIHLAGHMSDEMMRIDRRPDCQLCGSVADKDR